MSETKEVTAELDADKKQMIQKAFDVVKYESKAYGEIYNGILSKEITSEVVDEAKSLSAKLSKYKASVEKIHKAEKSFYWNAGKFVDSIKNKKLSEVHIMQSKLKEVIKYEETQRLAKIDKIKQSRIKELEQYDVDFIPENIGEMDDQIWGFFFTGAIQEHKDKEAARKKAEAEEADRKAKEQAAAVEKKRLDDIEQSRKISIAPYSRFAKNLDLRLMEQSVFDSLLEDVKKQQADYDNEQEAIRKKNAENEARIKQQEAIIARQKKEAAEKESRIAEQEAKRKEEAKAKAQAEAQAQRIADQKKKEAEEAEKNMNDSERKSEMIQDITALIEKYHGRFTSEKNKKTYAKAEAALREIVKSLK